MANFLLIFYIASACIDSYASEHNMMRNFKLFLMPALMAYLSFHANHDVLLYIALLLSWAGDVYLVNKTKKNYQLGLISFLLAHITYGIYFIHPLPLTSLMFWVGVLLYGIAVCLYLKLILPIVPASFKKATIVYMITITFMSLMAYVNMIKTMNILSWLGTIVFLISDTLLSYQIYTKSPQRGVMETYSIAQLLIVLGVIYASGI